MPMRKTALTLAALGLLVFTGAGCLGRAPASSDGADSGSSSGAVPSSAPAYNEELPELDDSSSADDVEAVVTGIEEMSGDVNDMSASVSSMEQASAPLPTE